ncbi:MAG: hypothetical protein IKQ72_10020 [Bacteroidaceae bacterium]|jgi:hypothetical protein|nr:hypothetical protein [Bacteroidaceae bacterium]
MIGDKKIKLPEEERELLGLLSRYLKLEAVDKLSVATTFVVVALVMFALGTCALFFLSAGLVKSISVLVGDEALANYIVGGSLLLVIVLFYAFRVRLVENRVVAAISASILRAETEEGNENMEDDEDED